MNNNIDISELIVNYITDSFQKEEKLLLDKWLEDPYNKLQFDLITSKEAMKQNSKDFKEFDPKRDWNKLDKDISKARFKWSWMGNIASILLIIGIGIFAYMYVDSDRTEQISQNKNKFVFQEEYVTLEMQYGMILAIEKDTVIIRNDIQINIDSTNISYQHKTHSEKLEYNSISIPRGKQYQLSLSDGSKVWLNADSKLRFPVGFVGQFREVFVENGEVFFDVAKNPKKPFIVHFNNHTVRVLGTKFNVKSYTGSEYDQITLAEGSIVIDDSTIGIELKPDQQAVINNRNRQLEIKDVNATIFCAWKNKKFMYKHEKLENIMIDLARFYDINVFYRNENVKAELFSLRLSQEDSFETILENFELTGKVKFEINNNNVIIQ